MFNKVVLVGNVGAVPRMRRPGGQYCATLQLATHRSWSDREGQRKEDTQWHPLVFWGPQAELAGEILDKGQLVMVDGRLKHSSWADRDDPSKTHYRTEVVVEWFRVLSPKAAAPEDPPSLPQEALESQP